MSKFQARDVETGEIREFESVPEKSFMQEIAEAPVTIAVGLFQGIFSSSSDLDEDDD